ncbi:MAG: hypothetical protein QXP27_08105 [Candidatus Methanomethyliaceae archaeon]
MPALLGGKSASARANGKRSDEAPALLEEKKEARAALYPRYGVRQLEVFGSAARGDFASSRRGFDFLVEFEPLPQGKPAKAVGEVVD